MSNLDIETGVKGRRPDPPVPAEPVTMWMIEQLEIFIADPATPLVAKHLAAAYLFCCYERRLDGGIAVNVCDRIHEACACDV